MDQLTFNIARSISPQLTKDFDSYHDALSQLTKTEPGRLDEINREVEKVVNVNTDSCALDKGDLVEIVRDNKLVKAKVRGCCERVASTRD